MNKKWIFIILINLISIKYAFCNIYFDQDIHAHHAYDMNHNKLYNSRKKKFETYLYFLKKNQNFIYMKKAEKDITRLYFKYKNYNLENLDLFDLIIDQFIKYHQDVIYTSFLIYIQGLVYMQYDKNFSKYFFYIKKIDSNPKYAYLALNCFKKLVKDYPKSIFIQDAKKFVVILNERIAKYNLEIIRFYIKKKSFSASNSRIIEIIQKFPNTKSAYYAKNYLMQ
ncbi:putative lipoprotein precursor [Wigglesworthia glossinidia endosymbiont of Glossina morsitans morsitans (Yale colony)]|uniref:Putative lipoprotein n=1 Tax=Wigglesworthia glossinidia endosymbiont of Glossina morsitans morsitans (Yale colony) TaxID=1142511 RepID=H6Q4K3_WIGGL|nr:outer membrane protein assembly factor BamD [Wigglesworthia glossinidia]AFA41063.1 putative lipoprotein precursor [Wigglesworthia glossinidia endosymbiont of Glossina morsitans morsitans (Yale colony)]